MLTDIILSDRENIQYFLSSIDPSAIHHITRGDVAGGFYTIFFDDENFKAMICPKCYRIHPQSSRFCSKCGKPLTPYTTRKNIRCTSCNHVHPLEAKFCTSCGQKL